jgi:serine/threonine protein kinase
LGICLFELLTFEKPFDYLSIFNRDYSTIEDSLEKVENEFFKNLIRRMLQLEYNKRPRINEIVKLMEEF